MQPWLRLCLRCCVPLCMLLAGSPVPADTVSVAVAANFVEPLRKLEPAFESATGHSLEYAAGSTGQLYAQIVNGAPFDVLLAADRQRPRLLVERGLGLPETRFTYAVGRLALWTAAPAQAGALSMDRLERGDYRWLAIANPELAPYGRAARQALAALGLTEAVQRRLVLGQSVAQAFAMVATGNADYGLVALSQLRAYNGRGEHIVVPASLHAPIRQDAVILQRAANNPAAHALLEFLRGPAAAELIRQAGYGP